MIKLFRKMLVLFVFCVLWNGVVSAETDYIPTFTDPAPFEKSFLDNAWYGRLNDNINVYAEPNRFATVVRNVGDGYLYSSLNGTKEVNGETWYIINHNEYVHADDITTTTASEFQGVLVNRQPTRAFGWFVSDMIRPSLWAGGPQSSHFPRLPRYTFFQVYDAVSDSEEWIWYNIGGGRWIKQTDVSLVNVSPRPKDLSEDEYWVEVDLYEQTFAAYEGDRMVYASLVSSGLNQWPTDEGLFPVWDRWTEVKMSGAEGEVDYYFVEDVPHTMFFDEGIALHGAYWHDRFGYKHSHGCVNMPPRDSEWVYNWSDSREDPLWVWVHTSDPTTIFEDNTITLSRADFSISLDTIWAKTMTPLVGHNLSPLR